MRKHFFILILIFFSIRVNAQTKECIDGMDNANADFQKGIYKIYISGLQSSTTFGQILKEEYGIDAIYSGCLFDEKLDCYSKFMHTKIKEKFGQDIFEKITKKAELVDICGGCDKQAVFSGGEKELMKFIYCNLDLKKANYSENNTGVIFLSFVIDTTGVVTGIKIIKGLIPPYDKEVIRVAGLIPKWTPAIKNEKSIIQQKILQIKFDSKTKEIHCR
ncbi:MAG: hypothetical protein A3H98_12300 [Bacteroidetes bacterium RIFCSPLOWO2_02_FULL_36_8]|nr:MAG: hypothetical protein A3H98_12300 [Bacteroidetes bacterium RIFCSPLOWO2_02_FULL_36_8]